MFGLEQNSFVLRFVNRARWRWYNFNCGARSRHQRAGVRVGRNIFRKIGFDLLDSDLERL